MSTSLWVFNAPLLIAMVSAKRKKSLDLQMVKQIQTDL